MGVRVARVLAPNPGVYTLEGTNTWIVGEDPAIVIDPGPADRGHLDAVLAEAGRVGTILLTHTHEDHADGAAAMAAVTSARVFAADRAMVTTPLTEGQVFGSGDARVEAVTTPGHTPDHVVFRLPATGAMFTGDMILGRGTSVIDPPEGNLGNYLDSLRRMLALDPKTLFPGHGPTIFAGRLKVQEYLDHRAEREAQMLEALATGPRTVDDLVAEIYEGYPGDVLPLAARSVLAHLMKLRDEDRVESTGRGEAERFSIAEERTCSRCGRPIRGKATLCPRCSMDALQEGPDFR